MSANAVSIIGVGAIGAPIAQHLLSAGLAVTVCDRDGDALSRFEALGARVTRRPSECAKADVVLVLVATAEQVQSVVLGEDGLAAAKRGAEGPLVVVMSTVGPVFMRKLQDDLAESGMRLLDAPVSGGILRAARGELTILTGGDARDLDTAEPILHLIGNHVFHCGSIGAGQMVKVVNNGIAAASVLASAETFRLALDHGIALNDLTPILEASSGRTHLSQHRGEAAACFAAWTRSRRDFDALTSILHKDLTFALSLAKASATPTPFIASMERFVESIGDATFGTWRAVGDAQETS